MSLGPVLPLLLLVLAPAQALPSSDATLTYHYERPGLPVPVYTFTVHQDGSGTYVATYVQPPEQGRFGSAPPAPAPVDPAATTTAIQLTPATTARLFEHIRSANLFRGGCASRAKNIANTGDKTLDYSGPGVHASCGFNYTESKPVSAVVDIFGEIANTLDTGRKLEFDHRFDRLGLDQQMTQFVADVQEGRALEVQTIAPTLRSIVDDPQVIERVRIRAGKLLELGAAAH